MPNRVLCFSSFCRPILKVLLVVILASPSRAAHPLEEWERILTSPQTGFVSITAGTGAGSRPLVVVADGSGKLITWPQDEPTNRSTYITANRVRAVTYGNGRFVAVGLDGPIVTSTNGYVWRSLPVSAASLTEVVFANGVFLASRLSGLMRSTNGVDWTVEARPALASHFSTLHVAGNFFVLASPGTNYFSTDGLNWIPASSGTTENLYTIGFGRGLFVAVDIRNELLTSRDGRNWERQGKLDILRPSNIAVGNGYLVMVGGGARAYSRNGRNWTVTASRATEGAVVYANGQFLACGYLTVHQSGEIVDVEISRGGNLVVNGVPNKRYQIEAVNALQGSDAEWTVRHVFSMGGDGYEWQDGSASDAGAVFYRVVEQGD